MESNSGISWAPSAIHRWSKKEKGVGRRSALICIPGRLLSLWKLNSKVIFLNSHLRISLLIWENEEKWEGDRQEEKQRERLPSVCTWTRDQICNLGVYSDQGLNRQTFGEWDNTTTYCITQAGNNIIFKLSKF